MFVYIKHGLEGQEFPLNEKDVMVDATECVFQPMILAIQTNQKLVINSPNFVHDIYCEPKSAGNREFNFPHPHRQRLYELKFPAPEFCIYLRCAVHPWMGANIAVFDHPFFTVTDKNGLYQLPSNLPPGEYTLRAAHLKAGALDREIVVKAREPIRVDFEFALDE